MIRTHAAIVLAAGGSTRLGTPKQLLTIDGETLGHRSARLALASGARRVLVIGGAHADAVHASVADLPVEWVCNAAWQDGLASSVRLGAHALAAHDDATLVIACDQPRLTGAHIDHLLEAASVASSGCAASRHAGRPGIPAVLAPRVLQKAHALRGDRGFRDVLTALPPQALAWLDAPELDFDLDTPADVAHAIAQGWIDPPRA